MAVAKAERGDFLAEPHILVYRGPEGAERFAEHLGRVVEQVVAEREAEVTGLETLPNINLPKRTPRTQA